MEEKYGRTDFTAALPGKLMPHSRQPLRQRTPRLSGTQFIKRTASPMGMLKALSLAFNPPMGGGLVFTFCVCETGRFIARTR